MQQLRAYTSFMRYLSVLLAFTLLSCSALPAGKQVNSSASSDSSASSESSSSSSSVNPKAPKVYLQWQEKNLPPLVGKTPRRKLSLIVSGAARDLVYVGTFNGREFDRNGIYVNAPDAIMKASIGWADSGDEIWIDRSSEKTDTLVVYHRNIDEERPYLSVERILTTVEIPGDAVITVQE